MGSLREENQAGKPVVVGGCVELSSAYFFPGESFLLEEKGRESFTDESSDEV